MSMNPSDPLRPSDLFAPRHIGPNDDEVARMLAMIGFASLDELSDATVPAAIRMKGALHLDPPRGEHELLAELKALAEKNRVLRSFIGMGYHGTITPGVILRNILENPGWYTQYTPYQAEIAQGRLEALLNFQTMVSDLTGLPVAGASLLDEATAAAEAMAMCRALVTKPELDTFVIDDLVHPQTIAVVETRARSLGIKTVTACVQTSDTSRAFGVLVQYPATTGVIEAYAPVAEKMHAQGALLVAAADLLALTLLKPPGEWGADIAVGSTQRFGVPMGFGGPHAGYIAVAEEYVRKMPGRLIGVSRDAHGNPAYRMAIQTREQHIKRDRATSNICTAQALLAIIASMYAVYHGPEGLKTIARRVHGLTRVTAEGFTRLFARAGAPARVINGGSCFDTITLELGGRSCVEATLARATALGMNLRDYGDHRLGITLDETTTMEDVRGLWNIPEAGFSAAEEAEIIEAASARDVAPALRRASAFLTHPVFNTHHSETEMLRYIFTLQGRDLSLANSMIPLGSCTMKLNATSEMIPVTWPAFANIHPFAPADQTEGYRELFTRLERWLSEITGFAATSLQPNAGSQGEYAGLLVIRAYHEHRGEAQRDVCLIPTSAHGTNPASAVIAGMRVVAVACDARGNIDVADLRRKAAEHADTLAALMVTYPSTHGVFEETIGDICAIIHEHGGQVYMDGANMNAQVGLCRPGDIGADVCHLNLHKTFCIPHGGGGPGMGPISVAKHLAPFLPSHPVTAPGSAGAHAIGPVSAAPYGSPSILPISYVYIALMGAEGLKKATQVAILNANYMAKRLAEHYPVLYTGANGLCAHEFILDCRAFDKSAGVKIDDIAKRLMDYGFHAPTMAWPVPGTLMIEPTESESKAELDRFCEAMILIRAEIRAIEEGRADREDNVLKHAPHTIAAVCADHWTHPYAREQAAYPAGWLREGKFWPHVGRIDNPYGDRHLVCTCPPVEEMAE